MFLTRYMKILVQYLYQIYRRKIMKMLLPPYILHLIFYLLYVGTSELFREELHQSANLVKANDIVEVLAVKDEKISSELLIGIKNVSLVVCMQ